MNKPIKQLMQDFHLWVDKHYYKGTHFEINGFYVPREGVFKTFTLDELVELYFENGNV